MREQLLLSHFCNKRPISVYREGGIKKKKKIQDMKFSNYGTLKIFGGILNILGMPYF